MIGEGAFIGSHATLVAPVRVGDGALVAAGSVVTHDVAADAMAVGRARQVDKPGRAATFRATRASVKRPAGGTDRSAGGPGPSAHEAPPAGPVPSMTTGTRPGEQETR